MDNAFVDGCGLPRQVKLEAHGLAVWGKSLLIPVDFEEFWWKKSSFSFRWTKAMVVNSRMIRSSEFA
jgi:hypothetical protein